MSQRPSLDACTFEGLLALLLGVSSSDMNRKHASTDLAPMKCWPSHPKLT